MSFIHSSDGHRPMACAAGNTIISLFFFLIIHSPYWVVASVCESAVCNMHGILILGVGHWVANKGVRRVDQQ